jgi:TRAP-type C4-dicarboxylate transport system permease large subunit
MTRITRRAVLGASAALAAPMPLRAQLRAIVSWLAPLVVVLLAVTLHPPLATWLPRLVLG